MAKKPKICAVEGCAQKARNGQKGWTHYCRDHSFDFTQSAVTAGLAAIFPSTSATYANIMGIAVRAATRLEAIFLSNGVSTHYGDQIDLSVLLAAMAS